MNPLQEIAQYGLQRALDKGCSHARIVARTDVSDFFSVRDTTLDRLLQSGESSLYFHLFVDGRYGTCSTNRTEKEDIDRLLDQAIEAIRFLAPDPCRTLAPRALCYKGNGLRPEEDLQVYDPSISQMETTEKQAYAFACAAEAHEKDPRLLSVTANYTDSHSTTYLIDSQGLECFSRGTFFSVDAECSVQGPQDSRPSDWEGCGGAFRRQLTPGCGTAALRRSLEKINPKKIPSGNYSLVVENRCASQLLSPLIQAAGGNALQQKSSFLLDRLHTPIASPLLTLADNPFLKGCHGARLWDGEGLATQPGLFIDKGVLQTYYISTYFAHKMDCAPTVEGPSVLTVAGGQGHAASLIASLSKGIFVTGFNGGNCNGATGDFSYGIEGFLIENGELTHPLSEMLISGNMLTLWQQFAAAGNDPLSYTAWKIPSLLFHQVACTGL